MLSSDHELSRRRQCTLQVSRATPYCQPKAKAPRTRPSWRSFTARQGHAKHDPERGRAVLGDPVVWVTPDGAPHDAAGTQMWPPSRAAHDAPDAVGADLPGTQHQQETSGPQDPPLPARSPGASRSGAPTSPISTWSGVSCIWSPSWIGIAARFWPDGGRIPWRWPPVSRR